MIDILKDIINISDDKKNTLLYFLDEDIKHKVQKYPLVNTKDLYLNNSLICINKSNLLIEYNGKIININNKIKLLINNKYTVNINPNDYYIFLKNNKSFTNDRKFYEELLKKL